MSDLGFQSAYPTITGAIFEFGFPDAIQQMWAAFLDELAHGRRDARAVPLRDPRGGGRDAPDFHRRARVAARGVGRRGLTRMRPAMEFRWELSAQRVTHRHARGFHGRPLAAQSSASIRAEYAGLDGHPPCPPVDRKAPWV